MYHSFHAKAVKNGSFPTLGVPFLGGPHIKDYSILGSILGYPNFGKVPNKFVL